MAMTESQVAGLELERVMDVVPVAFEQDGTFYREVEKRDVEKISARDMRIPIKLKPGGRTGSFDPDGGGLGRGDGPTYDKAVINTINVRHAVEITQKANWATDDKRKAVLSALRKAMVDEFDEFRAELDRYTQNAGDGVLANITAVATSGGKDLLTLSTTDGFTARMLRYGNYYGVFDTTLATKRTWTGGTALNGEGQIDLYDPDNNQVRMNVTATSAGAINTDKLVVSGLTPTPVWLYGVPYHHNNSSTGTWLGFTRSATPEIRASGVNAAGNLALTHARLAVNKIYMRVGFDKKKYSLEAWMHPCQVQAYEQLGQLVHHIERPSGTKDPGLSLYFDDNMQLAGARVRKHANWNKTRIDLIIKELWGRAEMHPAGFYEADGKKVFEARSSDGGVAAALIFYFVCSWNLFMMNPAAGSYIYGLTIPTGY